MVLTRSSTVDELPADPLGEAVADALAGVLAGVHVELAYTPDGAPVPAASVEVGTARATGAGPPGWQVSMVAHLSERVAELVGSGVKSSLRELLEALPEAGLRAAAPLRHDARRHPAEPVGPALRRALRDLVASEILGAYLAARTEGRPAPGLVEETLEFLIELSGSRVEAHALTHGVVIADVFRDPPRIPLRYPADIRAAKRAPLLFDGQRSVLLVDTQGRARTELQRHRLKRLGPGAQAGRDGTDDWVESGSLVAETTAVVGGLGFFLRDDRSIWTFVDGQPLLVRHGEHWSAFPLELSASIEGMIGGGSVASLVARAAFMVSARPRGAILAIVDDAARLDGVVSVKDRYDLRNDVDPSAMRIETRLHHLIDAEELDDQTLVRLAVLDGATVLDRDGHLLAYGAIVTSADSEHEGARTAAARTLSETAEVVLEVSVDGDITIFRKGRAVTTLLGRAGEPRPGDRLAGAPR